MRTVGLTLTAALLGLVCGRRPGARATPAPSEAGDAEAGGSARKPAAFRARRWPS